MKLTGIFENVTERLYFGKTNYFEDDKGTFRWVISDTEESDLGFTVITNINMKLGDAIELFLSDNYAGSFDKRKNELQRQADAFEKIKEKYPNYKLPTALYEKYNIQP